MSTGSVARAHKHGTNCFLLLAAYKRLEATTQQAQSFLAVPGRKATDAERHLQALQTAKRYVSNSIAAGGCPTGDVNPTTLYVESWSQDKVDKVTSLADKTLAELQAIVKRQTPPPQPTPKKRPRKYKPGNFNGPGMRTPSGIVLIAGAVCVLLCLATAVVIVFLTAP